MGSDGEMAVWFKFMKNIDGFKIIIKLLNQINDMQL